MIYCSDELDKMVDASIEAFENIARAEFYGDGVETRKTMNADELAVMLEMPAPDTHCWDDDTRRDVWSYSAEQVRAYALAHVAAERERCAAVCDGVREAADHAARDGDRKTGAMASAALCAKLIRA